MSLPIRSQFLRYLLGEKSEIKIGKFWIVRLKGAEGNEYPNVETDAIRASRLEWEKRAAHTKTKFDGQGHKKVLKQEKERLIKSPPPPISDDELSLVE